MFGHHLPFLEATSSFFYRVWLIFLGRHLWDFSGLTQFTPAADIELYPRMGDGLLCMAMVSILDRYTTTWCFNAKTWTHWVWNQVMVSAIFFQDVQYGPDPLQHQLLETSPRGPGYHPKITVSGHTLVLKPWDFKLFTACRNPAKSDVRPATERCWSRTRCSLGVASQGSCLAEADDLMED